MMLFGDDTLEYRFICLVSWVHLDTVVRLMNGSLQMLMLLFVSLIVLGRSPNQLVDISDGESIAYEICSRSRLSAWNKFQLELKMI